MKKSIEYNQDRALAVKLFYIIRDIPYRIPLKFDDADNSCHGKCLLLDDILVSYGFKSRIMSCSFGWSKTLKNKKHLKLVNIDIEHHYFIEIYLDGRWIKIDPTFDSTLKAKLPVNEWDGNKNTGITSIPEKFFSETESREIFDKESSEGYFDERMRKNGRLYKALNKKYEIIRKNKTGR